MNTFNIGDTVDFKDEFGNWQIGQVVSLEPAGQASNGLGIKAGGIGTYIRKPEEIQMRHKEALEATQEAMQ